MESYAIGIPFVVIGVIGFIIVWISIAVFQPYRPEKFECTIKPNVSFESFNKTFVVDEQRGDIYVVHLKK